VKRHPDSPVFAERLAFSLMAVAGSNANPEEGAAQWARARELAETAAKLGDQSQIEKMILETTKQPYKGIASAGGETTQLMTAAEQAFTRGDLDSALAKYEQIYALDPKVYEAALFAGDVEFRKKDVAEAGKWFARAIAIDPNRETAYRYWGDALDGAGKITEARDKFIAAIVAEPYNKRSSVGLVNWAKRNGFTLKPPDIHLPAGPTITTKDGKTQTNITIAPEKKGDNSNSAWLIYQMQRALFQGDMFAKAYPEEKKYRHSLEEEVEAIGSALTVDGESKSKHPDPNLLALRKLSDAGLLESWILLDDADDGIAQDYAKYRDAHRDKLTQYIREYWIHAGVKEPAGN
jgi:tetratricopeptide (TPR) repeat protein